MLAAIVLLIPAGVFTLDLAGSGDFVIIDAPSVVANVVSKAVPQVTADYLDSLKQSVESNNSLARIITAYNLYPGERSGVPMEDSIEEMKRHIGIETLPRGSKNVAAFVVRFSYHDPFVAQKVTDELAARFVQESLGNSSVALSVPNHASSEHRRFGSQRIADLLVLGMIFTLIVVLFRR
jgi:hypothetical protein